MKLIEHDICHFLNKTCPHKISEEELKEAMDDPDAEVIFDIPVIDSQLCTNCLLTLVLLSLTDFPLRTN